ncbi:hypothetical protein AB0P07_12030 [Streptomyces sp. NPDC085944]|uniref:hypothetical protein n=1 Tax=Streptomyces sp. NPDC085944 TaxID=3154962 RepID=UPI00342B5CC3
MTSRTDTIAAVLRRPRLTRPVVAHELRERLVQGLEPGGTATEWTATVPQLAEAINTKLEEREAREQKDTRGRAQRPAGGATAREEILAVLESAGYNTAAAAELLARAHREPRTNPPDLASRETLAGGHALVVEYGDCEFHGSCQCGRRLGTVRPSTPVDVLAAKWERHTCTEVHALSASNGAS